MDYYLIFGMVAVSLIAISTSIRSIKNDVRKEEKEEEERRDKLQQIFNELNLNIVNLTNSINNMQEKDKVRDKRLDKHGEEIDELRKKTNENAKEIYNHETRLKHLEKAGGTNDE